MRHPITDLRLTWNVVYNLVLRTSRIYVFLLLFVVILFILQWLFNIDQLFEIVLGDSSLSFIDRLDFLIDGFINIFRFADDIVPISMILISLIQALTITLLLAYRSKASVRRKQALPLGLSVLGIGCVACGGSVLTPILGLVATNVSVAFAESISQLLLILALVVSYISLTNVSFIVAQHTTKRTGIQK